MIRAFIPRALLALAALNMLAAPVTAQVDPPARGLAIQAMQKASTAAVDPTARNMASFSGKAVTWPSLDPLPKATLSLAQVRAGIAPMRFALVGDSTVDTATGPAGTTIPRNTSMAARLARKLRAAGIPATDDSFFGLSNRSNLGAIVTWEPRLSFSGGWSLQQQPTLGGNGFFLNSTDTVPLTWTPTLISNQIDIYYLQSPGFGTFTVDVGGAPLQTIVADQFAQTVAKVTVSTGASAAAIAWNIKRVSGQVYILGTSTRDTAVPSVEITNCGWSSSSTTSWVPASPNYYSPLNALKIFAPHLTALSLGVNDRNAVSGTWAAPNVSLITYSANIPTIITAAKVSGDIISILPPRSNTTTVSVAPDAVQEQYDQALMAATLNAGGAVFSIPDLWGKVGASVRAGMMIDDRHQNPTGVDVEDEGLRDVLRALR